MAPDGPGGTGGGPSAPAWGWVEPSGWTASPLHSRNEPQVPQKVAPCSFVAPQTLQTIKPALPVVDRRASLTGTRRPDAHGRRGRDGRSPALPVRVDCPG